MPARPIRVTLALSAITIAAGLALRFAPLGLPHFVTKWGGSTLWAVMIYWIVSALLPRRRPSSVALLAGALATAIEVLKLYNPQPLDAFRHTLAGIILLGRIFSGWDILAYWLAISVATLVDWRVRTARPMR
jgi:hypothetical protein